MGPTAKVALIAAMVALVCAVQLLEREFAAARAGVRREREAAEAPVAALLRPLEDPPLPEVPLETGVVPEEETVSGGGGGSGGGGERT